MSTAVSRSISSAQKPIALFHILTPRSFRVLFSLFFVFSFQHIIQSSSGGGVFLSLSFLFFLYSSLSSSSSSSFFYFDRSALFFFKSWAAAIPVGLRRFLLLLLDRAEKRRDEEPAVSPSRFYASLKYSFLWWCGEAQLLGKGQERVRWNVPASRPL